MQIKPGDYVAVSDITCEAIHAAVVKCFEAAGYKKYEGHVIGVPLGKGVGIGADEFKHIESLGRGSAQRRLTLQQLFTATNSIRWPSWAEIIVQCGSCIAFCGGPLSQRQAIVGCLSEFDSNGRFVLARNTTVGTRPTPELGWFDWSADRARELPPVGETVAAMVGVEVFADIKILAYDGDGVFVKYTDGSGWGAFNAKTWLIKPQNYEQRKAELARDKFVKEVGHLLCGTKTSMKPDESYYYQYAEALYNAGYRRV